MFHVFCVSILHMPLGYRWFLPVVGCMFLLCQLKLYQYVTNFHANYRYDGRRTVGK